ncbi:MAG: MBL fold metallo-hydrolase, partial [Candidatus Magasanikbacteria bacterium]|nr:MBL fold metallo-hydrolase [Candidatus Magasanikbacteria bacterium]
MMRKTTTTGPGAVRRNSGKPSTPRVGGHARGARHSSSRSTQRPRTHASRPSTHTRSAGKSSRYHIPGSDENLRIIPVGGCEEVGRNMTIFEYGRDIVILDMGVQFPEEDMPGIDLIIPNISYLKGREKDIRGIIFSHGHLDHIGAAPFLLDKLGYPVIAGKDLTLALIKHKLEDRQKGSTKNLKTIRINGFDDVLKLGKFTIKFFQVEHSIMDAVGVIVETPAGIAIHPGDWTMERDKKGKARVDYKHLAKLKGKPSVLLLESLGAIHDKSHGTYEEMYK